MKFLPVLVHAISFIFRLGGKANLRTVRGQWPQSIRILMFAASLVNGKHVYDVQTMHLCYNKSVYIFHRALVIIYRCLTLTSKDSESRGQLPQNIKYWCQWMQTVVAGTNVYGCPQGNRLVYGCPQGNRLGTISSLNLQDEAPTPLPVAGPLFIYPLFHLSQVLLGAWRFSLFHCVYSSFCNRLDLNKEPAFYSSFVAMKKVCSF